jgi:hypothetical protein
MFSVFDRKHKSVPDIFLKYQRQNENLYGVKTQGVLSYEQYRPRRPKS